MTYYVSKDDERFTNGPFETPEEAIQRAPVELDLKPGESFFLGQWFQCTQTFGPDADGCIEAAQEFASNEHDDSCEDWLEGISDEAHAELDAQLKRVWDAWLDKYSLRPTWGFCEKVSEQAYDGADLHVFRLDDTDTVVARTVDDAWEVWCESIGEDRKDYTDHFWEQMPDGETLSIWEDDPDWEHAGCDCQSRLAEHKALAEHQRQVLENVPQPARAKLAMGIRTSPPTYPNGHIVGCDHGAKVKTCAEWAKDGRGFLCSTEY